MIGLTILTPIVVMLLFFVVAAGRLGVIESKLTTAARSAARAASQHRSVAAAQAAATTTAEGVLGQLKVGCERGPRVIVHEMDLSPGGKVEIQVSCAVKLSDFTLLSVPGSRTVSTNSVSVVDIYRSGNA